jgi:hypothetical protein
LRTLLSLLLLFCCCQPASAQEISIQIKDAATKAAVPFAAVRLGSTGQGVIADLYGNAQLPAVIPNGFIEITALGYEPEKIAGKPESVILLNAKKSALGEVVVRPDYDKIRRIIRLAIAARDKHNPERYDWYRCHVYYKMRADAYPRDPEFEKIKDTSKGAANFALFTDAQHLLVSETYSIRSWKRPQKLQEEVLASRFSGFRKSMITGLVTDILPFHAYSDFLKLNGKDYRNPISRGSGQWYEFNLSDEILQGTDTVWIISFFPKKAGDGLRGSAYISSRGYAISNFIGNHTDPVLGNTVRIEQQYRQIDGKWFPSQLNYVFDLMQNMRKDGVGITMQGSSNIDSVSFTEPARFRFDKVHTVKLRSDAESTSDSAWSRLRPTALDRKELRTYVFMDSIMDAAGIERFLAYMPKLMEAKFPIGPVDLNLERLYAYNSYEGSRFGLGLQTNEKISKHFSVGGWGGYGAHDKEFKYGGFTEVYLDKYRESSIRVGYEHNLRDPGRLQLNPELDRNYLRNYLMSRADVIDAWSLSIKKRFGYLQTELGLRREEVTPMYPYSWNFEGATARNYTATEASLSLRYAFAERSAPVFGKYFSTGSKFPMLYAKVTQGVIGIGSREISYTQVLGAFSWQKHIARIGQERWLIQAGKSFSDAPLPLGKLFAAAGVRHDRYHVSIFGGLQTIFPYTYFSDAFVSWSWRHEFDWKFYQAKLGADFSSRPGLSLQYNGVWGTMQHRDAQVTVPFQVPDAGFHEGGILVQDILRLRYANLYYLGFGAGYFQPLDGKWDKNAGTYVLGVSVSL